MRHLAALVLLLSTLMGCRPQPERAEGCQCRALAAESAYAVAYVAVESVSDEMPRKVTLEASYPYFPVAGVTEVADDEFLIRFDRVFLETAAIQYGPEAMVGIFAHELAHAVDLVADVPWGSDHEMELRADHVAGCALALSGCQLSGFLALLFAFSDGAGSGTTHPAGMERAESAQRGYDSCAQMGQN
jgi:hypothetical protein